MLYILLYTGAWGPVGLSFPSCSSAWPGWILWFTTSLLCILREEVFPIRATRTRMSLSVVGALASNTSLLLPGWSATWITYSCPCTSPLYMAHCHSHCHSQTRESGLRKLIASPKLEGLKSTIMCLKTKCLYLSGGIGIRNTIQSDWFLWISF